MSPLCCELLFLVLSQCNKHCKTHCSTLQHTATSVDLHLTIPQQIMSICLVIPTATQRSNVRVVCVGKISVSLDMKHAVAPPAVQHTARHCNTPQHTARHCNTIHTARHCNTPSQNGQDTCSDAPSACRASVTSSLLQYTRDEEMRGEEM